MFKLNLLSISLTVGIIALSNGEISTVNEFQELMTRMDVKCKVGFKGGCKEHKTLKIKKLSDQKYSVKTCFEQCILNNECDGFFIGTKDSFCHLYKSGCTKDAGKPYTYYPMENCEVGGWLLGDPAESCDTVCNKNELLCSPEKFDKHRDELGTSSKQLKMIEKLGGTTSDGYCTIHHPGINSKLADPAAPWFNDKVCYRLRSKTNFGKFNCSAEPILEEESNQRICFCHMKTVVEPEIDSRIIAGGCKGIYEKCNHDSECCPNTSGEPRKCCHNEWCNTHCGPKPCFPFC